MNIVTEGKESTTLYYREGSSDKVYQVSLEPIGDLFVVNFAFGRRGSTLNTGTKKSSPVDYGTGKAIYDKLVREKTAKGYTPGEDGTPYQHTDKEERATGILPQLLNPIDENAVRRLVHDTEHCMQEKFDGRRVLLRKRNGEITGINRKGLEIGLPSSIIASAGHLPGDFILDGECVGDLLHVFDVLEQAGEDLRKVPYKRRLISLTNLLVNVRTVHLELVRTAFQPKEKARMLDQLRQANKEGVVFKHINAPYRPGRPNSGGTQLKHKFYATLSAVVAKVNPQRSVEIRLLDKEGWQPAGNVTIPANQKVPSVGAVLEIRYLYAFPESGSLYQPTCLGIRQDVDVRECLASQLKFKNTDEDDA
jgi:bifunctional non-homologous end joining protein LigD